MHKNKYRAVFGKTGLKQTTQILEIAINITRVVEQLLYYSVLTVYYYG
jgi:hypothetical protein